MDQSDGDDDLMEMPTSSSYRASQAGPSTTPADAFDGTPASTAGPESTQLSRVLATRVVNPISITCDKDPVIFSKLHDRAQQTALAATLRGSIAEEPCAQCATQKGPFQDCILHKELMQCTNCLWQKKYKECSHHSKEKIANFWPFGTNNQFRGP